MAITTSTVPELAMRSLDATLYDYGQIHLLGQDTELVSPTLPVRTVVADLFAGAPDTTL